VALAVNKQERERKGEVTLWGGDKRMKRLIVCGDGGSG